MRRSNTFQHREAIPNCLTATTLELPQYRDWLRRCYDRPAAQKVSRLRRDAEAGAAIDTVREAAKRNRL